MNTHVPPEDKRHWHSLTKGASNPPRVESELVNLQKQICFY